MKGNGGGDGVTMKRMGRRSNEIEEGWKRNVDECLWKGERLICVFDYKGWREGGTPLY